MTALARLLAPYALAAVIGALLWHWTPFIGPAASHARQEARHDVAIAGTNEWKRHALGWMASYRVSESRRGEERQTSQAAATSLIEQCAARVAEARQSARVIERIVTKEPTYDPSRCPVRELVDPRSVREALQPAG
ncbi:hypothetical protein ASG17_07485 [Brevundimonas sp. Leaf363]|uniref:hypothetical protein n=1 Tax=Brevundimonas sp. Leaf363 TaxID=1736353 RepID=UPI0006FF08DB|nr:hypothetical protein [Brevundimonas sp. Leaf363]KQS55883.1 hypothetical protein ASG17_07485 [Brevundimonas sp. Leaf363]